MNDVKTTKIRGFDLAYHQSGAGEPMLMVHGITTYSFIWRKLIPRLSKEFKIFHYHENQFILRVPILLNGLTKSKIKLLNNYGVRPLYSIKSPLYPSTCSTCVECKPLVLFVSSGKNTLDCL